MAGRGCQGGGREWGGRMRAGVRSHFQAPARACQPVPAIADEALRAGAGVQGGSPSCGTKRGGTASSTALPQARHRKRTGLPAEPYALICRDQEGVTPITRHNARYSGIGGV